jgi:bacterioferritin (cytochrome b1)
VIAVRGVFAGLKGAEYMAIAKELETHATEELAHALTISKHIDYLGGTPTTKALEVKMSDKPKDLLRFDLDNENETIRNYRERVRQCEAMQEYAIAEDIREILRQEQEHQVDLATGARRGGTRRVGPRRREALDVVPAARRASQPVHRAQRRVRRALTAPAASSPSVVHAISHALANDAIRARTPSAATRCRAMARSG